jgi:hypothetical protein
MVKWEKSLSPPFRHFTIPLFALFASRRGRREPLCEPYDLAGHSLREGEAPGGSATGGGDVSPMI